MAGLAGHKDVTDGLLGEIRGLEKFVNTEIQEIAINAAIEGATAIEETIASTPSSLSPGKADRNWTWHMTNSVTFDYKRVGTTITIKAGWLKEKEEYFLIQEHGGEVNGVTVTPMRALQAGHTAMTKYLTRSGVKVP